MFNNIMKQLYSKFVKIVMHVKCHKKINFKKVESKVELRIAKVNFNGL